MKKVGDVFVVLFCLVVFVAVVVHTINVYSTCDGAVVRGGLTPVTCINKG